MRRLWLERPVDGNAPAFGNPRAKYKSLSSQLKHVEAEVKGRHGDEVDISTHALRRTGARLMYSSGLDIWQICEHGCWHSTAVLEYLDGAGSAAADVRGENGSGWLSEGSRRGVGCVDIQADLAF